VLPERDGSALVLCGADYLTGGYGLLEGAARLEAASSPPGPGAGRVVGANRPEAPAVGAGPAAAPGRFPVLLIHDPPPSDSPLSSLFRLAFAGHTHGGQLRLPGRGGLAPLHNEDYEHLSGVHEWGQGKIVISRGVGTGFLPFRLFTRPEATLWRLV
jgi:predicted MPP superfamily phosphohydrolase